MNENVFGLVALIVVMAVTKLSVNGHWSCCLSMRVQVSEVIACKICHNVVKSMCCCRFISFQCQGQRQELPRLTDQVLLCRKSAGAVMGSCGVCNHSCFFKAQPFHVDSCLNFLWCCDLWGGSSCFFCDPPDWFKRSIFGSDLSAPVKSDTVQCSSDAPVQGTTERGHVHLRHFPFCMRNGCEGPLCSGAWVCGGVTLWALFGSEVRYVLVPWT